MPTGGGGGGGGGLATVSVTARLTGNGTGGSPLDIAGLPNTYFFTGLNAAGNNGLGSANTLFIIGFVLPVAVTFSNINVLVNVADAVNLYDIGLYTQAGALTANIGAQHLPSTGLQTFATVQGVKTIIPGLYIFAFTGNATTANLKADSVGISWRAANSFGSSAGGALPASIAAQTVTPFSGSAAFFSLS